MSLLDQWLVGSTEFPFEKAASFLTELRQPTVPPPIPERTAQVQAGQLKIATLTLARGVDALPEIERRAMVDPDMQAAVAYEQAKAENAELTAQLEASQAQLAMQTQQQQMAEQQLMQAQQAQQELEAQAQQAQMEAQQAQAQAVEAQQASLAERVQSMEQREQLAQAATDLKGQLEQLAEGVSQLRGQAAGPPPGAAPAPIPEPDPTAPANVRKEQEQAQKAELEAEQQKIQAGLAEEQEMQAQGAMEQQAAPPPSPPGQEQMAPPGPGAPIAGAPQVPTPAGGALPKTSSEKLAAGSSTVQLPMSRYPKAPAKDVLIGASAVKLPAVGRVIPAMKRLTEESSRLDSAVEKERLQPDAQPEIEKKEDPELKEKQAAMWQTVSAESWLGKLGSEDLDDAPVEQLAEQLKGLSTEELQQLFSSLSKDPEGDQVMIARRRSMVVPDEGPATGKEEYRVGVGGEPVAERMQELGIGKESMNLDPRFASPIAGAVKGGILGAVTGGLTRGGIAYSKGGGMESEERRLMAMREAARGAAAGAVVGAASGGIAGAASLRGQEKAVALAPRFDSQTGQALSLGQVEAAREAARRQALAGPTHLAGVVSGYLGGLKGPELARAMVEKEGSAHLHPKLAKLAEKYSSRSKKSGRRFGATVGGALAGTVIGHKSPALSRAVAGLTTPQLEKRIGK